jgi:alpha-L-rhamnosidase
VADANGSAGWGDAAVIVPWEIYRAYGDERLLAEIWPTMVSWLDFVERNAVECRRPDRVARSPEPAPHERYLWDTGFHWGEWLVPGEEITDFEAFKVRALAFDLVPEELRDQAAAQLVRLIHQAGTHLQTGFLATPYLLPVLADHGYPGIAYELLLQDTPPSWLTMIDRGATTVWEDWEGIDEKGRPHASLNHYSKGAVISFLHRYTAGIRLGDDPAYRSFRIEPVPGGGIMWATGAHESPYGRIESSWSIEDDTFRLEVHVPPGTTAELVMPGGPVERVGPGRHTRVASWPGSGA